MRTIHKCITRAFVMGTVAAIAILAPHPALCVTREPTFEQRVDAQRAIEEVYWRHRIWPEANPGPKPPLSAVMSDTALRAKVEDYLKQSNALAEAFGRPVTAADLQAEMERMGRRTKAPDILRELFAALGDDPDLIAETLVRQRLVGRAIRDAYAARRSSVRAFDAWWEIERDGHGVTLAESTGGHERAVPLGSCTDDMWTATLGSEVPDGRVGHTAVWTGSEMIVWGGGQPLGSTGGRYDPATDTWTATSTAANVPQARSYHQAVWTGIEMIIWGGYDGTALNTGGRYDPSSNTWAPMSTGHDVPSPRYFHTVVWTGTEMIVWGGSDGSAALRTGARYEPASDSWIPVSTTGGPVARSSHTAVWTGTKMIVWGGALSAFSYTNSGGLYDPISDSWSSTSIVAGVPTSRVGHTAVWSGSRMIVWGGSQGGGAVNTGGQYDPATNQWTSIALSANTPSPRDSHTAVWAGTFMIVWGGFRSGAGTFNTGALYSPALNQWFPTSTGAGVPADRQGHTAVWTGTEMIVWGGSGSPGARLLNTGGRYDPNTDTWRATLTGLDVPSARYGHRAVWTGSEMIVWGGVSQFSTNTGGRYDPATDAWVPTSTSAGVPPGGSGYTAVWTGTEMLVWGGPASSARYNPATDTWSAMAGGAGAPVTRTGHTAVWTGTRMIVWGGIQGNTWLDSGGRYDPVTDTWATTSVGPWVPSARANHSAVWTGTQMIVWGGNAGITFNTGAKYDPTSDTWVPVSTTSAPSPRSRSTAVWTGNRMIVWGGNGTVALADGYDYDPAADSWSPIATTGGPSSRYDHTAIWTGDEMIVWGGYSDVFVRNLNTGGRYEPASDSWFATSTGADAPLGRTGHTAVWTGSQMIVWGGVFHHNATDATASGGVYCATPGCSGNPARCDDGNVCTDDSCDGGTNSCSHFSVSCDDGNACTTEDCDPSFGCVVTPLTCPDDQNACTAGFCDPASGCQQVLIDCTDSNACTTDSCDPSSGQCSWTPGAPEIRNVRFASPGTLQWNAAESGAGLQYQVLRGSVASLPVGAPGETCIAQTPATTASSGSGPGLGAAFWYLVRSDYAQCNGTYGYRGVNGTPGSERTSAACP